MLWKPLSHIVHFYLSSCRLWGSLISVHFRDSFNHLSNRGGFIPSRCSQTVPSTTSCGAGIHIPMDLGKDNSFIFYSTRHLLLLKTHSNCITDHVGLFFPLSQDSVSCELDLKRFFKVISFIFISFWVHSPFLWSSVMKKTGCPYLFFALLITPTFCFHSKAVSVFAGMHKTPEILESRSCNPAAGRVFWLLVLM